MRASPGPRASASAGKAGCRPMPRAGQALGAAARRPSTTKACPGRTGPGSARARTAARRTGRDWSASTRLRRTASVTIEYDPTSPVPIWSMVWSMADDHRDQRLEGQGSSSRWAGDWMAPSRVCGVAEHLLQPGHVAGVGHVDLAELALEAAEVGRSSAVSAHAQHAVGAARTWGTPNCVGGDLVEADPGRRSSPGRLHSSPNWSRLEVTMVRLVGRRTGDRGGRTGRTGAGRGGRPSSRRSCRAWWARSSSAAPSRPADRRRSEPRRARRPARPVVAATRPASRTAAGRTRAPAGPHCVRVTGTMVTPGR